MGDKKRAVLIDLSAVYWWKWHAAAGSDVDAAYRYSVDKVRSLAEGFDYVAICCDSPKSFRKELYPEYKANRPPREPAAMDQLRRVEETLTADGYPLFRADGFEGDDVIATLAAWTLGNHGDVDVVIAGNDKDLLALLFPGVTLRHIVKDEVWDGARVKAELGVTPAQMRDYLALVGDSADNVKGAKGVGPKTAAKLLAEYGSIDNIYDKIDSVMPDSARESLIENEVAVHLAMKLVSLNAAAPVDCPRLLAPREPQEQVKAKMQDADFEEKGQPLAPLATTAPQGQPSVQQEDLPKAPAVALATIDPDPTDPRWVLAMEPKSSGQAYSLAKAMFASNLYRKFPNPEAIFAVILSGRSKGIDMMTALDGFHVIEGRPTMSAALIIAMVMRSGKAEFFELIETTNEKATWETKRVGARKPLAITFTIADAQRAGLVKPRGNWEKYPRAMCQWRAGVELARAVYADVCSNVYTPDELGDPSYVETTVVERKAG